MPQREIKVYLTPHGVTFVDPGFDCLPLIKRIHPEFEIRSDPPPPGYVPSFQKARKTPVPEIAKKDLQRIRSAELWDIHGKAVRSLSSVPDQNCPTLLDLKIELARRELENCRLCAWNCSTNRFVKPGPHCGLREDANIGSIFCHVAEEPQITPSVVVKLNGCTLRCRHCQASENFVASGGIKFDAGFWDKVAKVEGYDLSETIQLVGGNPDESVYAILLALSSAPDDFDKPIVWNNNGYANEVLYKLLDRIVDVWLTDFKYWSEKCGERISEVNNYPETARRGIEAIVSQQTKVIVRHLILPGHFECCSEKVLEFLEQFKQKIRISIIDNYIPDWKALNDPKINRMVSEEEISKVKELLKVYELRDISESSSDFWEKTE